MSSFTNLASLPSDSFDWLAVLLSASLKGFTLLIVAGVLSVMLRRASAATRHLLWSLSVTGLLALFLFSPVLNGWRLPVLPEALNLRAPAARPVADNSAPINMIEEQGKLSTARAGPPPSAAFLWHLLLLAAWLAGVVLIIARLIGNVITLRRVARHAVTSQEVALTTLYQNLCEQLQLRHPVKLIRSERVVTPITWGWLNPAVMLPVDATSWPVERQRIVLLHELAHVKRRDCLTQMLAQVACAVSWFNPLVWFAAQQLRKEREMACDDYVLAMGTKPSDYAGHLLEIARSLRSTRQAPVAAVAMARRSEVENRLRAILNPRIRRRVFANPTTAVLIVVMVLIATPLGLIRPVTASHAAEALLVNLKEGDPDTREAAARWLAFVGDDRVLPTLTSALGDEEEQVREWAARSLGFRRAARAVEPLIQALKDEDLQVREAGAWALGRIGDRRAVEPLTEALEDEDGQVREHAARALEVINRP